MTANNWIASLTISLLIKYPKFPTKRSDLQNKTHKLYTQFIKNKSANKMVVKITKIDAFIKHGIIFEQPAVTPGIWVS